MSSVSPGFDLATIRDVARASGVSIATVSRVINGSARVSEATRRRVSDAAATLDYWPNGAARTLTTRRTHALGVLLPDLHGEFFSEIIRGIDRAARREKLQTLISSSHADTEAVLSAAQSMRGRVDALIVMAPDQGSSRAIEEIKRRFPLVLINPRFEVDGCSAVSIANFDGAYAIASHLLARGHRRVAILTGPPGNVDAEERLRGYRKALRKAGIAPEDTLEIPGDFSEASGLTAARQLTTGPRRVTAVLASNDYMAIGLLSGLRQAGVDVPGQMAVTGFDDIAMAQYVNPPLTTVRVDASDLGERAVKLLMESVRPAPRTAEHLILPAQPVIRQSCGGVVVAAAGTAVRRKAARS